ncbi:MAG: TonB-dependent receptor, partial [Bacteroidales bacterium]|nr:TonB-dependent receptor [Bacteroidales bacterium]
SPALNISLANDFQWNKLFADVKDFVYPQRFTLLTALAASLKVGGLSLQGSLLYSYVKDKTEGRGTNAGDKNNISPSVVLSWRPFIEHNLNFRAFYKRAHRMPTFNDLYYTEIGNKYLAPERTTQYDVGIFWSITRGEGWFKSFSLQADAYYNTVTDKIVAMPTSSQFRWSMMNIGKVKIKGLEASGNLVSRWGNVDCSLRLSYTYQDARDYTDPQSEWYKGLIAYIPLHSGTAVVTLNYKEWQLHYSFIYTGEKFDSSANIQSNMLDSWTTHDIALSKEFGIAGNLLRTTLELNNITNTQYEVVRCYPMPGLNFKLKVNYLF